MFLACAGFSLFALYIDDLDELGIDWLACWAQETPLSSSAMVTHQSSSCMACRI